jgi:hypothetical protein
MMIETRHNPDRSRYEIFDDGQLVGVADHMLRGHAAIYNPEYADLIAA